MKIFDSHLHIIDSRYPLVPNNGYLPDAFTCDDYVTRMKDYDLCGGAIVSGSFQGFDQTYLKDALSKLGSAFVVVTNLATSVSDQEIIELNFACGNYSSGGYVVSCFGAHGLVSAYAGVEG